MGVIIRNALLSHSRLSRHGGVRSVRIKAGTNSEFAPFAARPEGRALNRIVAQSLRFSASRREQILNSRLSRHGLKAGL
jgi:hypothetical protein